MLCLECKQIRFQGVKTLKVGKPNCPFQDIAKDVTARGSLSVEQAASAVYTSQLELLKKMNLRELKTVNANAVLNAVRVSMMDILPAETDRTEIANHALTTHKKLKENVSKLMDKLSKPAMTLSRIPTTPVRTVNPPRRDTPILKTPKIADHRMNSGPGLTAARVSCTDTCQFGRLQKGKEIECSLCQACFHRACVGVKPASRPAFWICQNCRDIPNTVKSLVLLSQSQQKELSQLRSENATLTTLIEEQRAEFDKLSQPPNIAHHPEPAVEPAGGDQEEAIINTPSVKHSTDAVLLIGDSIIRDISEHGLENTTVKCIRGGRIKDIKHELDTTEVSRFSCVMVHVGTNDCTSEYKLKEGADAYVDLVNGLKTRAPETHVVLSTICPRTDNVQHDNRVSRINEDIRELAAEAECGLVENNCSAADLDASLRDRKGLHLSKAGTRKLLRNFNATRKIIIKRRDSDVREQPSMASSSRARNPTLDRTSPRRSTTKRCFFCGERNHMKDSCRHGKPLQCYTCHGFGHKSHMDLCHFAN